MTVRFVSDRNRVGLFRNFFPPAGRARLTGCPCPFKLSGNDCRKWGEIKLFGNLNLPTQWTFLGVAGLLAFASTLLFVWRRTRPDRINEEFERRIKTAWVIAGLFAVVLAASHTTAVVFFAFVSFLAFKEYLSLIPTRRADHRVLFWAYLAIPIQYVWVHEAWIGMFVVFIPVYMFLWLPTRMVMIGETRGFLRAVGTVQWGLMSTVFSLSHAAMLLSVTPSDQARVAAQWSSPAAMSFSGAAILVFLVLMTQLNDAAQFCWGKWLGRVAVVPKISPGKTVSGMVGGMMTTLLLSCLIGPWLTYLDLTRSLIAGFIIAVSGFAGDLTISALKRDLGVKDSGCTLPGHGGVLDRVDSLTYTAPLFFHFVYYCYG